MRRALGAYLLLFLAIASFAGLAWLTRHPEAEIVARAEDWPYVGPLATRFREAYLPAPPASPDPGEPEIEFVIGERRTPETSPPSPGLERRSREQVWVLPGAKLKAERSRDARTLHRFPTATALDRLERQGAWYRVDYHGVEGWVLLENYREDAEIPYGDAPDPPLPLPPRPPDPERLASARVLLGAKERRLALGPYALYTDVDDDRLIAFLGRIAGELDRVYAERHGLTPLGTPREAVVLYRGEIAYRLLQQRSTEIAGLASAGHADRGLAALYAGDRSRTQIAATLVHELVHFLNRRALGPQLPPWLDEGIADDLALARVDPRGRLDPAVLGGVEERSETEWRLDGGRAALHGLRTARALPRLPELLELDWRRFVEPGRSKLHYATSAFLVRYLLADERYAERWRGFLAAVAAGEPPTAAELQRRLGVGWEKLEKDFQTWIAGSGSSSRHTASPSS